MAYISAEEVKQIRQAVKKALPAFKVSVTRDHHSGVIVALQAGPVDFGTAYTQINTYHFTSHYADRPAALDVPQLAKAIIKKMAADEEAEALQAAFEAAKKPSTETTA